MKILYIAQRLPYPPNRGDRIPTFNHIRHLSRRHEVFVASLLETAEESDQVAKLKPWTVDVVAEVQSPWRKAWGMALAFLTGKPLSVGHFHHPRLAARVHELILARGIEAVVVFSSSMAPYVESEKNLVRVMNFCDMDSQKWRDLAGQANALKAWVFRREAKLLLDLERRIARSFHANCVVTEAEAELFHACVPGGAVTVVANGVEAEYFGAKPRRPEPCELAFVGVMDYAPNIEAVCFFVERIWPQVRAKYPEARFTVVGARPTREVKALAERAGVTVTGFVDDVRDYLARATLVVVPLHVARGIQNKILEAMAAGAPVLTTPVAAKGLAEGARATLFIEPREPEGFATALLRLLGQPELLESRALAAQAFVRDYYSWEKSGETLEGLLKRTGG